MVHDWGSDLGFNRVVDEDGTRCEVPIAPMIENMHTVMSLRDRVQLGKGNLEPLENILCLFYGLKTSDPRDKIFAMLGIASGECLKHIKADYGSPAPDIYLDAMKAISQDITNFSLLSFAGLAAPRPLFDGRPDIPSWVPDFSTALHHSTWWNPSRLFNATALPANGGVRSLCYPFGDDEAKVPRTTTLFLHGVCCDTIVGVLRGERSNFLRMPKFIKKTMAIIQSLRPYPNGESARDVLMKTLIAADYECLQRDSEGKGFDELYNLAQSDDSSFNLDNAWGIEGQYMQTMIREGTAGSRGVFWTRNGYVGLAANEIDVGDEVWLIKGARIPFMLRGPVMSPKTNEGIRYNFYHLVCEAYVHGVMNGELSDVMEKSIPLFLI